MMKPENIRRKFEEIGATVRFGEESQNFRITIEKDRNEEYFQIHLAKNERLILAVDDTEPDDKHLLLMTKEKDANGQETIRKFLCGHDERHWFVASVPERPGTVRAAKEALKPTAVRQAQHDEQIKTKHRHQRINVAFKRQGEWFFVPQPDLQVQDWLVLRDEPFQRVGGTPHKAQFLFRQGGTRVKVCREYPDAVTLEEYHQLIEENPEMENWGWWERRRGPRAFVKGKISHPDHTTLILDSWHRLLPNTENQARGSGNAFID